MDFLPPLADARDFPVPTIRALPFDKQHTSTQAAPITDHQRLLYGKARHALYHIARASIQEKVWLPAYHCPALVEPFLAAGKDVSFYSLNADLTPRLHSLREQLKQNELVVSVRYFGFDCGVSDMAKLCRENNCVLVEDLAHAALTQELLGDLAVTSLVKFYPVSAGAELWLPQNRPLSASIRQQYEALSGPLTQRVRGLMRKVGNRLLGAPKAAYRYFDANSVIRCLSASDNSYLAHRPAVWVSDKRREHYQRLAKDLRGASWGKVLFEQLPEHVSPYVLPFLLNDETGFAHLRNNGIQIYRWEEIVSGQCDVSLDYRQRLVQLPCHQELSQRQLHSIAEVLR